MKLAFDTALTFMSGARVNISGEEAFREERLFRVACALNLNNAIPRTLFRLYERAGHLRVFWSAQPTDARVLRAIHQAWSNECENVVTHYLSDGKQAEVFLHDEGGESLTAAPVYRHLRPPEPPREAPSSNWLAGPPPPSEKATP